MPAVVAGTDGAIHNPVSGVVVGRHAVHAFGLEDWPQACVIGNPNVLGLTGVVSAPGVLLPGPHGSSNTVPIVGAMRGRTGVGSGSSGSGGGGAGLDDDDALVLTDAAGAGASGGS